MSTVTQLVSGSDGIGSKSALTTKPVLFLLYLRAEAGVTSTYPFTWVSILLVTLKKSDLIKVTQLRMWRCDP